MPTRKLDDRGLYQKFEVKRLDGKDGPCQKHENCAYFVLDLDHDPFAILALKAYGIACREKRPGLAFDIQEVLLSGGNFARKAREIMSKRGKP